MSYYLTNFTKTLKMPFAQAIQHVTDALGGNVAGGRDGRGRHCGTVRGVLSVAVAPWR